MTDHADTQQSAQSAALLQRLKERARQAGVGVEESADADHVGGGMYDRAGKRVVMAPRHLHGEDLSVLAHEIGHAEFDKTRLGFLAQSTLPRAAAGISITIGALIAVMAEGGLARRLALSAGTVAAAQVPLLLGEAEAWRRGHEMMREHGATEDQLAQLRHNAMHMGGSYLRPGIVGLAGATALSALAHSVG